MGALLSSFAATCCAACACEACRTITGGITRTSARLAYCGLFALSLLLAWVLRDYAEPLFNFIPWVDTMGLKPSHEWFGTQAVLRVSFGTWVFFALFALLLIGVEDQDDVRDSWHHGGWMLKLFLWLAAVVIGFLLPNGVIGLYGSVARFGSGLFLLVQMVILLDFAYSWNEAWVAKDDEKWYMALLVASVTCYLAAITGISLLYLYFVPSGHDCHLNSFFITFTLLLVVIMTIISLHPEVRGSLLPAGVVGAYCVYLCFSALSSEPRGYECNGLGVHMTTVSSSMLALGMMSTLLSVVYSALRVGSNASFLSTSEADFGAGGQPLLEEGADMPSTRSDDKDSAKPVAYVYSFFHIIFALAAMYSAMLLTGWGGGGEEGVDIIDVGWPSVWVKETTQWATAAIYVWSLVAPIIFADRDFY
eukprot:TRINITY_DN15267_c0_g1_i1.p1 TRINITY_DN15267_c0_g1~~TRINITY_DN15267_c0_g1_i1.p1  ORF type:complete len:420 (+),score=101.99 TRINITY_DN15267_c0_g1_i1:173-1432(+)